MTYLACLKIFFVEKAHSTTKEAIEIVDDESIQEIVSPRIILLFLMVHEGKKAKKNALLVVLELLLKKAIRDHVATVHERKESNKISIHLIGLQQKFYNNSKINGTC